MCCEDDMEACLLIWAGVRDLNPEMFLRPHNGPGVAQTCSTLCSCVSFLVTLPTVQDWSEVLSHCRDSCSAAVSSDPGGCCNVIDARLVCHRVPLCATETWRDLVKPGGPVRVVCVWRCSQQRDSGGVKYFGFANVRPPPPPPPVPTLPACPTPRSSTCCRCRH